MEGCLGPQVSQCKEIMGLNESSIDLVAEPSKNYQKESPSHSLRNSSWQDVVITASMKWFLKEPDEYMKEDQSVGGDRPWKENMQLPDSEAGYASDFMMLWRSRAWLSSNVLCLQTSQGHQADLMTDCWTGMESLNVLVIRMLSAYSTEREGEGYGKKITVY